MPPVACGVRVVPCPVVNVRLLAVGAAALNPPPVTIEKKPLGLV